MKHWVVVADAGSCRIYETDEVMTEFTLVSEVANEHAHEDVTEIVSGPRGATRSGPGGVLSALDRHTDPRDAERAQFARRVAGGVNDGWARRRWERVVLVAPPRFLGMLRRELSEQVTRHVAGSIDRDLTRLSPSALPDAVRSHLPDTAGMESPGS